MHHSVIDAQDVVIRFCGDSGDGMQLTGTLFADASALYGNNISTFPDYPAEIRAPHGTVSGVSGFQVHFGTVDVNTPGDFCDVLVAMNPAALRANAKWAKPTASIIIDTDSFDEALIQRAGYSTLDPITELKIEDRNIICSPITTLTKESLKDSGMDAKSIVRCKNMFTLGMCFFMFNRPLDYTYAYLEKKFKKKPQLIEPNKKVLFDGYNYASRDLGRVKEAIKKTYIVTISALMCIMLLFNAAGRPIIRIFMDNDEIVRTGAWFLSGFGISLPFMCIDFMVVGITQAFGMGKQALIFSFLRKVFLEIPFILMLNRFLGVMGVAYAQCSTEIVMAIVAIGVQVALYRTVLNESVQMK